MHRSYSWFVCALVIGLLTARFAAAQGTPVVTVDEFGNGTIDPGTGKAAPFPGVLAPDPFNPTGAPALTYLGPIPVVSGDVVITEPVSTAVVQSDLIRFVPVVPGQESALLFYSDFSPNDPANAPADVGLPPQFQTNEVILPETGYPAGTVYTETSNGLIYTPAPGMPGSNPAGIPITYNIISDSNVPEPASLGAAAGLLGLFIRRRSR